MFGLMEILEQLNSHNTIQGEVAVGIVPTVLLPLAFLSTGISVVATFIASLFGVKLKAEGPRKLLELLLRPKILISAMILNAVIYFGYSYFEHVKNGPVPIIIQNILNQNTIYAKAPLLKLDSLIWNQTIAEGVFAKGAIVDDELFVGSKEGNLFVLDIKTGAIKNKIYFGKFLSPTPIFHKGYLYFGEGLHESHHMKVYKFDVKKKEVVGFFSTKGHTEIFPVISEVKGRDILYQAAGDDGLYAIDPATMEKIWHYKDGHMDAYSLIVGHDLYIASGVPKEDIGIKRPYAYKLNALTGKLIWKKELPLSSWYGPIQRDNIFCFIQGELHIKSKLGGLSCLNSLGERKNNFTTEAPVISKPLVNNDDIIFNDFYGTVYSWNLLNNIRNWSFSANSKKYSYSSVQKIDDKTLLFVNPEGSIFHLDIDTGKKKKELVFNKKESLFADPLITNDGYILFGMKGTIKYYKK